MDGHDKIGPCFLAFLGALWTITGVSGREFGRGPGSQHQIRPLICHDFLRFLSNLTAGLTADVPAFTFSIADAASRFRSTVLV